MDQIAPARPNTLRSGPDSRGRFGGFGGRFVAETLMPLVLSVEAAYEEAKRDPAFQAELDRYLRDYVGRPSPLWFAERLTKAPSQIAMVGFGVGYSWGAALLRTNVLACAEAL